MEKPCGAPWSMVAKHRIPSRIQAQGGARRVRRDALEIASSEPLNSRHTRQYKANIQGIEGKAIDVSMDRPVPWKSPVWSTVGHGCETPDPQQDSSPRRCQKRRRDALEIASSNPLKAQDGGAGSFGLRPNPQTGRNGAAWARIRNSRTPAGFRPNGWPFGLQSRCRLGTFEPAKSKGDLGTLGTLRPR